jgi:hypothetical protein
MIETEMGLGMSVGAIETTDPLLCKIEFSLRGTYYPRGFSLEIATNSQEVLAAADESWGHCRQLFSEPPVLFRIGVARGNAEECPPPPACRAWGNLLSIVGDGENFATCAMALGSAFGWFTPATVENRAYFRYYFLEPATWMMLGPRYLTPIHGACVKLAGKTILLCGDSGAGKSSLAFACARRGWTFLSDDAINLVRNHEDRLVIGNPYSMRFREESVELFPELREQRVTPRATGEMAIEVDTASMPEIVTELTGSVDYIVFLNRQRPGRPCLTTFPRDIASSWFEQVICCGDQELRDAQVTSLRQLLAVPVYELCYRELDWAVSRLDTLAREGV